MRKDMRQEQRKEIQTGDPGMGAKETKGTLLARDNSSRGGEALLLSEAN